MSLLASLACAGITINVNPQDAGDMLVVVCGLLAAFFCIKGIVRSLRHLSTMMAAVLLIAGALFTVVFAR